MIISLISLVDEVLPALHVFRFLMTLHYPYIFLVGIWCDLLGDFHWREGTLSKRERDGTSKAFE